MPCRELHGFSCPHRRPGSLFANENTLMTPVSEPPFAAATKLTLPNFHSAKRLETTSSKDAGAHLYPGSFLSAKKRGRTVIVRPRPVLDVLFPILRSRRLNLEKLLVVHVLKRAIVELVPVVVREQAHQPLHFSD